MEQYAAVAERTGARAATVTEHRDRLQFAVVLVAAHQAGHDTTPLLDTAHARTTRGDNTVHDLATASSGLLTQRPSAATRTHARQGR